MNFKRETESNWERTWKTCVRHIRKGTERNNQELSIYVFICLSSLSLCLTAEHFQAFPGITPKLPIWREAQRTLPQYAILVSMFYLSSRSSGTSPSNNKV